MIDVIDAFFLSAEDLGFETWLGLAIILTPAPRSFNSTMDSSVRLGSAGCNEDLVWCQTSHVVQPL